MARYVWAAVVLQLATVAGGHVDETVLNLAGVLGTLIPFGVGAVFGARTRAGFGALMRAGVAIGFVGAVVAILVALFLGDATWLPLTWAPFAAAASGWLGAAVGRVWGGSPDRT